MKRRYEKMADMIRKANAFEIINHWVMAAGCFILAVTGYAFLFHMESVGAFFGGYARMRVIHNYVGIVFAASLFFSLFVYLPDCLSLGMDDITWFVKGGGYLSRGHVDIPPQGRLNSGQKLSYLSFLLMGLTISVSGFVIWLMPGVKEYILLSHLAHNIAFDFILFALPVHIYLASLGNPGTLRIMIQGTVPLEWAKKRHGKWVKEMGS
jgi:formate dehydrogenase subunit gamma